MIKKYKNKIGDKALIEKAKLLLSQERYEDVLKMQSALDYVSESNNTNEQILSAANALTILSLKDDKCEKAVGYIEKYKLDLEKFDKSKVFDCLVRTSRYENAKKFSELYIKVGTLKARNNWMQKYLLSLYKLNKYTEVINVGEDVIKLSKSLKTKPTRDTLEMIFFSLIKLKKIEKAIDIAKQIEKNSPNNLKNSDVFIKIVQNAKDSRNDLLLIEYANKIIALQKRYKSYIYTPDVELSLIGALQRLEKTKEALVVAKGLIKLNLTPKEKTRAFYSAGELSMKLGKNKEAKEYFTKCKNIKIKSSWKDICEQNLKLL